VTSQPNNDVAPAFVLQNGGTLTLKTNMYFATIASLLIASRAHAQEDRPAEPAPAHEEEVLDRGALVLDLVGASTGTYGYLGPITLEHTSWGYESPNGGSMTETTIIGLEPSADVMVTNHLSLGGRLGAAYVTQQGDGGYRLDAVPRVGYVLPIAGRFAFWPRLGVGYGVERIARGGDRDFTYAASAAVDLGVVMRVTKHLLIDFGPVFSYADTNAELMGSRQLFSGLTTNVEFALRLDF
jgi:hypothetical protein